MTTYEVAIVGGGPAGLQCALVLGRARRSVVVLDKGQPRNLPARESHGFLSRDGIGPAQLLEEARAQLAQYDGVTFYAASVSDAEITGDGFVAVTDDGERVHARRLVLATGMRDKLPEIEGLDRCWGLSAFVCPYCDGWEVRDRPIAVWGNTRSGVGLAQELFQWSHDIVVCADVATPISDDDRDWLARNSVQVKQAPIRRLRERDGLLQRIEFEDGDSVERNALFMNVNLMQCCGLAETLGCRLTERGHVDVDGEYRTNVPGVYAIGDAVTHLHQIAFAAASGARAAIALNNELTGIA